jgi:ABC-type multidrug transport system fused ATPase/permease subunit
MDARSGPISDIQTLATCLTPHRWTFLGMLLLLSADSLAALLGPWLAGSGTASILDDTGTRTDPRVFLALWLGVLVVRGALGAFSQYTVGTTGQAMTAELRGRLYQHLQSLPVDYFNQRRRGETLSLLHTDAAIIGAFVSNTLVQLLPALVTFIGALLVMSWLNITIALIAAACLPTYYLLLKLAGRKLRRLSRAWMDASSHLHAISDENLALLPAIKAFTREPAELERFNRANSELLRISRRQLLIQSLLSPLTTVLGGCALAALLWSGTGYLESGRLSVPELVTLLLYCLLLLNPLRALAGVYGQVQTARGAAERIIAFFNQPGEPSDCGKRELAAVVGGIRYERVSFSYPGRNLLLNTAELIISPGETVAITGENGAGKSTIGHLLLRYLEPSAGRVLIDGVDIADVSLSSLRRQVGLVAQQVLLFNASIAENIGYGLPSASREDIRRAARAARAHDFISGLPEGYDTLIGDQGVRLSGGQRQRIALARTLLTDPPILILDEATAMFDPASEAAFIGACHRALSLKTVIIITHRPASLALADRVLVLADGKLRPAAATVRAAS